VHFKRTDAGMFDHMSLDHAGEPRRTMNERGQDMITESTVATAHGAAYMKRLCKHFAHKIPATIDGDRGRIEFPFGVCEIQVSGSAMEFRIDVYAADDVDRAEGVVGEHLVRMANKDEPVVEWRRSRASNGS